MIECKKVFCLCERRGWQGFFLYLSDNNRTTGRGLVEGEGSRLPIIQRRIQGKESMSTRTFGTREGGPPCILDYIDSLTTYFSEAKNITRATSRAGRM